MLGKLISVKEKDTIYAYEFSKNMCTVYNQKIREGFYLIVDIHEHDFCSILFEKSVLIVRTETITNLIIWNNFYVPIYY